MVFVLDDDGGEEAAEADDDAVEEGDELTLCLDLPPVELEEKLLGLSLTGWRSGNLGPMNCLDGAAVVRRVGGGGGGLVGGGGGRVGGLVGGLVGSGCGWRKMVLGGLVRTGETGGGCGVAGAAAAGAA